MGLELVLGFRLEVRDRRVRVRGRVRVIVLAMFMVRARVQARARVRVWSKPSATNMESMTMVSYNVQRKLS